MSIITPIQIFLNSYNQPALAMDESGNVIDCNNLFLDIYGLLSENIVNNNYFNYFKQNGILVPGESVKHLLEQKSQAITFHRVDEKRFLKYLQWNLFEFKLDINPAADSICDQSRSADKQFTLINEMSNTETIKHIESKNELANKPNDVKFFILLAHDVTPILEVATKEQLLIDSLIDSLPAEIFWKDKSLVFLGCNKSFLKSHNLKDKSEVIGKTDFDLSVDNKDSQAYRLDDLQIIKTKKAKLDIIERRLFVDGEERYLSTSKVPLFDDQGELYGILGICLDITEHKVAEEKLKQAISLAEQANYTKTEFIANMSHDIRTPLSGVVGVSQLLMDSLSDFEHKQRAQWIHECGVQLLSLLNDILTVAAIDDEKQSKISKEVFSLRQCLDDLVSLERPSTEMKGISLKVNIDNDLPEYFCGDRSALYRILLNLLGNAIKFTCVGSVAIDVKIIDMGEFKVTLHFVIQDTGIGIPKDLQDKIFDRFYRANPSYKGVYSGHGIGLHIAKTYVNRMGGDLQFTSEVGVGTSFFFDLELDIVEDQNININSQKINTTFEVDHDVSLNSNELPIILIVEDNYVALKVLESIIKLANIRYVSANDGESALEIATRQNFNMIITDIGLPGISGKELTMKIRQWESFQGKSSTPIIGLTAHGRDNQILEECLKVGMNDVFSKPIDLHTIKKITKNLTNITKL